MPKKRLPVAPPEAEPPLELRIATALHKIGLAQKHETWTAASEEGVSPTQGQILAAVAGDGALTGGELAARLGVTLPTVSDAVRVLVDKGLVVKKPDPRHPRASLVALTARGRTLAAKARAWPELLATAVSAMSAGEQEVFHAGLLKMIRALQESGRIPVSRMCITCRYFAPDVHEGERPHHCKLVDAPMGARDLRLDCKEHEEAPAA